EPRVLARDVDVERMLRNEGFEVRRFEALLVRKPRESTKSDGTPYKVFTPFWKALLGRVRSGEPPEPRPDEIPSPPSWPESNSIDELGLEPAIDWASGIRAAWTPGEAGAHAALDRFASDALARYASARDEPAARGTSRLSPHLHFGEISVRQIWTTVREVAAQRSESSFDEAAEAWLRQIGWREFGYHLLFHFPHTTDAPLREEFTRLKWRD